MGFPAVAGTPAGTSDTSSTSFTVTLPGSIAAGELLLVFTAHDGTGTISQTSGGFTRLDTGTNGTVVQGEIWAKIAVGGDANPVFSSTNSQDVACVAVRVSGHNVADPPATGTADNQITLGTAATGTDTGPNPGNCNPGTARDFLWLAMFAADDDDNATTWGPTNYTQVLQQESAQSTTSSMCGVASRQLNAASEDTGAFTMAASEEWRAITISIPPALAQTFQQSLPATALGVAVLARIASYKRTLAATALGSAVLATKKIVKQAIAATALGVAVLSTKLVLKQALAAVALGVATLATKATFRQVVAATAVAIATFRRGVSFALSLAAVAIATLTTNFISGSQGDGGLRRFVTILFRRGRR